MPDNQTDLNQTIQGLLDGVHRQIEYLNKNDLVGTGVFVLYNRIAIVLDVLFAKIRVLEAKVGEGQ